jgi:hypothetical protein
VATDTAVLIPFAGTDPDRTAAYHHIAQRLTDAGIPVVTGTAPAEPWCKADAVDDALTRTDAEILVIHDADVWSDGTLEAIAHVEAGAPWAVPHRLVRRLDANATAQIHRGTTTYSTELRLDRKPYYGHAGGGITVLRRSTYESCPLDPRYTGWGQEDDAWALALTTLHGKPWRGTAHLWHHWHAPQERRDSFVGSDASEALYARYLAANGHPDAMRVLIGEARYHHYRSRHVAGFAAADLRPYLDAVESSCRELAAGTQLPADLVDGMLTAPTSADVLTASRSDQ